MKKCILFTSILIFQLGLRAQTNPVITSWLQNNTVTGRHYVSGNSTPISDASFLADTTVGL